MVRVRVHLCDDGGLYAGVLCPVALFLRYSLGFSASAVNGEPDNLQIKHGRVAQSWLFV